MLNRFKEVVHYGWPEHIKELPTDLKPYWSFRYELAIEDGVLFKGRQTVVPASMQRDILEQSHNRHQGVQKTRHRARDCYTD